MISMDAVVHYLDGSSEQVSLTQYELGEFDRWARRHKYYPSAPGRMLFQEMPILWLRVGAWIAVNRGQKVTVDFDAWNPTVIEVELVNTESPDPTQTDTQDEPLPE